MGLNAEGYVEEERLFLTDDGDKVAETVVLECREIDNTE